MRRVWLSCLALIWISWMAPAAGQLADPPVEGLQLATLGGGCFLCTEAQLDRLKGVSSVVTGYSASGGKAVQVLFNPQELSFRELAAVFVQIHDPNLPESSVIFYHDEEQREAAQVVARRHAAVAVEVVPFQGFEMADSRHQDYYRKHPNSTHCRQVIAPKLEAFRKKFAALIRD